MPRIALAVLVLLFTVYCLVDVIRTRSHAVRRLPKGVWVVITLLPAVGGIAWLLAGRPRSSGGGSRPQPRGPLGPDDDPDFLRGL